MTQEQVKELSELQSIFEKRCSYITKILSKMDRYCRTGFEFVYHYIMGEDCVTCMGNDIDGDNEEYTEYFDAKLLYASDEEIKKYVEEAINKAIEEEKVRQAKLHEAHEIQDRKTFEKLKKKYGWK